MSKPFIIYGLTGNPIHNGHVQSYEWLKKQGHSVIVSPAIGHEFKPEALANYPQRRVMCLEVFGEDVVLLEEYVLGISGDVTLNAIREGLKRLGHPVMAIDMLRAVRELLKRPYLARYRDLLAREQVKPLYRDLAGNSSFACERLNERSYTDDIRFAIGPDINVDIWTGIDEIRAEGFGFERLPEIPNIRSTLIRANIASGLPWEHMVPPKSAEIVKKYGMYGWNG